jgi:hypothetical protein
MEGGVHGPAWQLLVRVMLEAQQTWPNAHPVESMHMTPVGASSPPLLDEELDDDDEVALALPPSAPPWVVSGGGELHAVARGRPKPNRRANAGVTRRMCGM